MDRNEAEHVAARALAWLASTDDLMSVFLGATGASVDDIRKQAADPDFLGSVLDFLAMDDAWVEGFCRSAGLSNDSVLRARAALPGGEQVHWT